MILGTFDQILIILGLGQGARTPTNLTIEDRSVYIPKCDIVRSCGGVTHTPLGIVIHFIVIAGMHTWLSVSQP